ncbi:MAG: hypothetical protein J0H80_20440 [Rhizobiales bacterium]|nr:hypothetical protein [Hyphomicrobiales bacterium]
MKPDIDRVRLAADVTAWLRASGLSTRSASSSFAGINPAMLSRACTGKVLSAESLLALCRTMEMDPMRYLVMVPLLKNQTVTAIDQRETAGTRP